MPEQGQKQKAKVDDFHFFVDENMQSHNETRVKRVQHRHHREHKLPYAPILAYRVCHIENYNRPIVAYVGVRCCC